jgi:DegV family protein with EDD domain
MIRIVTDSTANIPAPVVSEFNIHVVPTHLHFGTKAYLDGVTLTSSEFFKKLVESDQLPHTTQPSVEEYKTAYEKVLAESPGATILSIHLSGQLSGIMESARGAAAALPDAKIRVFDTRSLALGHGLMVREAARMAKDDASEADIIARLERMRDELKVYWMFDTLEYLAKSGRIGRAARFMGGLLNVKPILTLKNGAIDTHSRERGRAQGLNALKELYTKSVAGKQGIHLAVVYSVCEDDARKFADELHAIAKPDVFILGELGPAIGVYSGPGAVGLNWWIP